MKILHLFNISKIEAVNLFFFKEGVGVAFAAFILTLFAPIYILNTLISFIKFKAPFSSRATHDLNRKPYYYHIFNHGVLRHLLILLLIVKREMTWVGMPRDIPNDSSLDCFSDMKVGLVSLYGLHQLTGLSISNVEEDTQLQREFSKSEKVYLIFRVLLARFAFRNTNLATEASIRIFGIKIDNIDLAKAVTKILTPPHRKFAQTACFVNVNTFNLANKSSALTDVINAFDYVFADGSGVRIAAQKQGDRLLANVNGTDMLPVLCDRARENNQSLFLLGAEPEIASLTAANLQRKYPGLRISGTHHGYFDKQASQNVICKINTSKTDVLLVAFGSPIQERWLQENKAKLNVKTAIAVGGLFDFYSGRITRAPIWMRELGMEWVWRLMKEPRKKFHRYVIGNPIFILRCIFQS